MNDYRHRQIELFSDSALPAAARKRPQSPQPSEVENQVTAARPYPEAIQRGARRDADR
jgi:hypothetical protein